MTQDPSTEAPVTFSWTAADGSVHEVEHVSDVDSWTGREIRAVERMSGGTLAAQGFYTTAALLVSTSVARVVPGATIEGVDAELTLGRVRAIHRQINERALARLDAEVPPADGEDVAALSPTSADGEA
jgi:hypothetical protein